MSLLNSIFTPPHRATTIPSMGADAAGHTDPRIIELDKINRDNDARLERLGLSRAVLEERMLAGETWRSSQQEDQAWSVISSPIGSITAASPRSR